tara:strand:+ start:768 stop:1085 length:318 start_codon:yes stop_codon:yes gene_type:complete
MRFVLSIIVLLLAVPASAGWDRKGGITIAAFDPNKNEPNSLVSNRVRVANHQATALVRKRYPNSKVLSVRLIESKGPPVYRVKTLSSEGVVKHVFVDGRTGDVFE